MSYGEDVRSLMHFASHYPDTQSHRFLRVAPKARTPDLRRRGGGTDVAHEHEAALSRHIFDSRVASARSGNIAAQVRLGRKVEGEIQVTGPFGLEPLRA